MLQRSLSRTLSALRIPPVCCHGARTSDAANSISWCADTKTSFSTAARNQTVIPQPASVTAKGWRKAPFETTRS
ncbi:hypothetical protein VTN02DRAFT_6570 [Thermoascus thermophilus]